MRRRRQRIIVGGVLILCVCLSTLGVGFLSYNDRVQIASVTVSGTSGLSARTIHAAFDAALYNGSSGLFSRQNMFLFPESAIKAALLQQFPRIANVSVSRASLLSQAVVVTVSERKPAYLWCADSDCYVMDSSGYIFGTSNSASTTMYVFRGGLSSASLPIGQWFLRGRINALIELFKTIERAGVHPTGAIVENEKDMTVTSTEGFTLKIAFDSDPAVISKDLLLILSSESLRGKQNELHYIDLRFGDRVYYQVK